MANESIREEIKNGRLKHWEVAEAMGVNENTLCRWLRVELSPERKELVTAAIKKLRGKQRV